MPAAAAHRMNIRQSVGWAGMTLPLTACVAIWAIGDASNANVTWLSALHTVIAIAASAWTVLRFVIRERSSGLPRSVVRLSARASLIVLYALLALQPLLALSSSMLHGSKTTVFGFLIPSLLPVDEALALRLDRLHGWNAVLLLGLIVLHVAAGIYHLLRHPPRGAPHRHDLPRKAGGDAQPVSTTVIDRYSAGLADSALPRR